jgi:hypothetical protein
LRTKDNPAASSGFANDHCRNRDLKGQPYCFIYNKMLQIGHGSESFRHADTFARSEASEIRS